MIYQPQQIEALHTFLKSAKSVSEIERARALLGLSKGKRRSEIATIFEININTLDTWQTNFKRNGILGIQDKPYPGNHHILTREQKVEIKQTVYDKTPKELGVSEKRFWSVLALKKLIQERYQVTFASEATYRKLFYSFEFSCHKPGKHNRNQNSGMVKRFQVAVKKRSTATKGWAVWYW